jgi:hypothetical protein
MSQLTIRLAESDEDREKLFRFRYEIYVEEMGRVQKHADHERRRIEEPFDAAGANFVAFAGDKVIGCVRWNSGLDTDFAEYVDLYAMQRAGRYFPDCCGTSTKFMVAATWRHSSLSLRLLLKGYAHARQHGMLCDFMDCNPHLEAMFSRFGYRAYRGRIQHPEYGNVLPMMLISADHEYLIRCGSPFLDIERTCPSNEEAVAYLQERFFAAEESSLPTHGGQV